MVLQIEDCAHVVTVLHPEYDYIFLFDHSHCGQDRKRLDGLCSNNVQREMEVRNQSWEWQILKQTNVLGPSEDTNLLYKLEQEFRDCILFH